MLLFKFHVKQIKHSLLILAILPFLAISQKASINIEPREFPKLPSKKAEIVNFLESFPEIKNFPSNFLDWFYWTNYTRQNPKIFWDSVVAPLIQIYPQLNTKYAESLKKELYRNIKLPFLVTIQYLKNT